MMSPDTEDRIYRLLESMNGKLDRLVEDHSDTRSRVAALEALGTKRDADTARFWAQTWPEHIKEKEELIKRIDGQEEKISVLLQFKARVGGYLTIAGVLGAAIAEAVVRALHLH